MESDGYSDDIEAEAYEEDGVWLGEYGIPAITVTRLEV